jgi:hypothetical protein
MLRFVPRFHEKKIPKKISTKFFFAKLRLTKIMIFKNEHFPNSPNATLRSAFSWKNFVKKIAKKNFRKFSVKLFFQIFLAIVVQQPIWGVPAKIWEV